MNTLTTPVFFSRKCKIPFLLPFLIIVLLFYSTVAVSQTLLFRERFSSSEFNPYSLPDGWIGNDTLWKMAGSGTDWGSRMNDGVLEITNDATVTPNSSGWAFAYFDNSNLSAPWTSSLINNTGSISWTFNMRQPRTDPSGFTIGNYGVAFVIGGSNNTPFNSGFGYAVVLGQAGTSDPLRLIRYNNGLSGSITNIIVSNTTGLSDFGNEYLSVEVRYFSGSNQWELLVRNDGSGGFNDPASGLLISQGSAIDSFYTSFSNLTFTGCYWCGNTAMAQNALFDNIQVSSGCSNSMLYYRTKKSGAWHQAENWEMSPEEFGNYRAACFYPNGSNAIKMHISQGDSIKIENNFHINTNHLIIDSGGICIMNDNASIHIANGNPTGADLEINGTFIDNANAGFGINFIPHSGAGWIMGPHANLIRMNSSSAVPYRDNYQNGMNNIPSTAHWIIRYYGKHVPFTTIATSPCPCNVSFPSATFYPNLIIESNTGIWNTASSIGSRFNGTNGYVTIKGNLIIGDKESNGVLIFNENNHPTPMLILGDLIIYSNSAFSNYNSLYPNQSGTGFEIKGNLVIEGTLNGAGGGISGRLILSGDKTQTISGTGNLILYDLIINNRDESVANIKLDRPVSVNGALKLIRGIVSTSNSNLLTLHSNATVTGGSFRSFINGPMQKIGKSNFIFPVGKPTANIHTNLDSFKNIKTGGYRPIGISDLSKDEIFTAEYHLSNPYTLGPISQTAFSAGLQSLNKCEYWDLKPAHGTSSASVTLSWSDNESLGHSRCNMGSFLPDSAHAVVVPYFNDQWGDQHAAHFGRTYISLPDSVRIRTITWNGQEGRIDHYEKFVVGSTDMRNAPLSLKVSSLNAYKRHNYVIVEWETTPDNRLQYIHIEKSKDGVAFRSFKKVWVGKAILSYRATDSFPYPGWGYYRLRLTDSLGNIYLSDIKKVRTDEKERSIIIMPNPAKDKLHIQLNASVKPNEYDVINSKGVLLIRRQYPFTSGLIDISSLKPGIYFLRIRDKGQILCRSFVKD